jgi:signal transduction histidine kinase
VRLSVRWRLTLWNVLGLAGVLGGFAALVYVLLARAHYERIDRALLTEFRELEEDHGPTGEGRARLRHWIAEVKEHEGFSCVVYDAAGQVYERTAELPAGSVPPVPETSAGAPRLFDAAVPGLGRQRLLAGGLRLGGRPVTAVLLAPLEQVDRELGLLRTALLLAVPAALALAGGWGYLMARKALAPVERLRRSTEDITASRLDRRLPVADAHDELGRLAQTINAMIARLEGSFAEMRRFTADASHELRTPLAAIRTEAEVALSRPLDAAGCQQLLGSILEECERLTRLTEQLLALAREDAGGGPQAHAPVDLAALVRGVVENMRPPASARGGEHAAPGRGRGGEAERRGGRPGGGPGGRAAPPPGLLQRAGQRHQVHPGGRRGDRPVRPPRAGRCRHRGGHGRRHPPGAPAARLRPLLPRGQGAHPGAGGHRPGPQHRAQHRRRPRRSHRAGQRPRPGHDLHRHSPRERRHGKERGGPAMRKETVTCRTHARALAVAPLAILAWAAGAAAAEAPALKLVQTIPLKGPAGRLDHLALDGRHGRLFVANMANASLDVVDLKAGKLVRQVPGQKGIQGIAYAPDLDRIFVGNEAGGLFNAFDGRDYRLLKTIKFADDADNVRYDPRRHLVYVAHAEKSLAVVDAKHLSMLADIRLPGQPEAFQLEKARPRLYLNTPSTRDVVVIDTDRRAVVARYPLRAAGGNYPLALDEAGRRLFVGCRKPPAVVVLDADSGKEVARVAIPGDTDDVFFDARRQRLYASCGEGFLAVVRQSDGGRYELLGKLATARGARTSLFDPGAGRLYVVVPRQQGKGGPEVRVYLAP